MQLYQRIPFFNVDLQDGFWKKRQIINQEVTIRAVWERFEETGRFRSFDFVPLEDGGVRPHFFWDSDVAKWIESAAYILEKSPDSQLEEKVDQLVDRMEQHQDESGYFNTYFTVVEPEKRFQIRDDHELYCLGHLIEAAVAYYHATGKDKMMRLTEKYADYVEKVFVQEQSAAFLTPGHEEIELALYKLYQATGKEKYRDLALHFLNLRGTVDSERSMYNQSHLPVRDQKTAEGHSVRACYLYSAMADLAAEMQDDTMYQACQSLFNNIYYKRMYITGGIGSSRHGEAFTVDYDLPNSTAYAETCAAISLAFFAGRMQRFSPNPIYADVIERVLYNGMLSGISLDGSSFFYENPLEILHLERGRNKSVRDPECYASARRKAVFDCSCCPPNVTRFLASVGDYLYTCRPDTVYAHQFMSGVSAFSVGERTVTVSQKTNYPSDGNVEFTLRHMHGLTFAVRIPMWCKKFDIDMDGAQSDFQVNNGYVLIRVAAESACIRVNFDMTPRLVFADPRVAADAGLAALCRGPIVYCMEECDNGANLRNIFVNQPLSCLEYEQSQLDCIGCEVSAHRLVSVSADDSLYGSEVKYEPVKARLIPYYAFANREECDMLVWFRCR